MAKRKTTSYPKDKIKVLLLENISTSAAKTFRKNGYKSVVRQKNALTGDALTEAIRDVHVLGVRSKSQVTKEVLKKAEKLLAIGCFCIGTNQVNLNFAASKGVAVFNAPFSNTRSVAELVIANAIMLIRKIPEKNAAAHNGIWLKDSSNSYELRGKTLGIIGYGHIGSQVSILAEALGMKVKYYDVIPKLPLGNADDAGKLKSLLSESDVVTLHVPATSETTNMINKTTLKWMKKGAVLLNLSRGSVVDLEALADALKSGQVSGAAVDVYPTEPKKKGADFETPLQGLPNVILTPHIGGSTEEAQFNIGIDVATKVCTFLDTGNSVGSHSIPPLSLPRQENTHRILHIHKNVPGVLSEINKSMSEINVNISGEYLQTNNDVGYVVLDVDRGPSKKALDVLRNIDHTIKARILY